MDNFLKNYIDKNSYKSFTDLFKSKTCLSLLENNQKMNNEEKIDTYLSTIIPTKSEIQHCKLELSNPPRQNTPRNIDLYDTEVSTKKGLVVGSSFQNFCTSIGGDYLKLTEQDYLDYQIEIEPLKISETNYQALVIRTNTDDIPSLPNDSLFLIVDVNYKKANTIWESYLLLAYQQYLSSNYQLARLLSFISII